MAGLGVLLETPNSTTTNSSCSSRYSASVNDKKVTLVINKATMVKPTASLHPSLLLPQHPPCYGGGQWFPATAVVSVGSFLDVCFLCKAKLLPGKDIYMYKGDKGFCSVECRYKQMYMDENDSHSHTKLKNRPKRDTPELCSVAAIKAKSTATPLPPKSHHQHPRRGTAPRNRASGGFVY